jgi:hypothetical protein
MIAANTAAIKANPNFRVEECVVVVMTLILSAIDATRCDIQ